MKTNIDIRTRFDRSNASDIVAPSTSIKGNQILNIKGKGLSKLVSIRTKARWSLPHLFQERKKTDLEQSKTGLQNSTQNGSIKAQRHSIQEQRLTRKTKTAMKMDSELESKLQRGSRHHTNSELKTVKQKTRTF